MKQQITLSAYFKARCELDIADENTPSDAFSAIEALIEARRHLKRDRKKEPHKRTIDDNAHDNMLLQIKEKTDLLVKELDNNPEKYGNEERFRMAGLLRSLNMGTEANRFIPEGYDFMDYNQLNHR